MPYQMIPQHSPEPPFLITHYVARCLVCGHETKGDKHPHRCAGCVVKSSHRLKAAHDQHCRCTEQPITEDWYEWIKAPYQVPPTIHKDWGKYKRLTKGEPSPPTFKDWLRYTPEPKPEDPPEEYLISTSGLSYSQWLDTPNNLTKYLRRDWKAQDTVVLTFNQWVKQR